MYYCIPAYISIVLLLLPILTLSVCRSKGWSRANGGRAQVPSSAIAQSQAMPGNLSCVGAAIKSAWRRSSQPTGGGGFAVGLPRACLLLTPYEVVSRGRGMRGLQAAHLVVAWFSRSPPQVNVHSGMGVSPSNTRRMCLYT